jgi:uncharacterized protein GlcG (DUF336 family)
MRVIKCARQSFPHRGAGNEKAGKKAAAVAVSGSHAELIAFLRMDGYHLLPLYLAINRAFTAAHESKPAGEVGAA